MLSSGDARPSIFFTFLLLNIVSVIFHPPRRINFRICFHFKRENVFYKNSLSKKVHKYTFLGLKLCFMLTINGLCGCEVGVLCRGSTPEVHSAGVSVSAMLVYIHQKNIAQVLFLSDIFLFPFIRQQVTVHS